jgi:hypothetical protein
VLQILSRLFEELVTPGRPFEKLWRNALHTPLECLQETLTILNTETLAGQPVGLSLYFTTMSSFGPPELWATGITAAP